MRSIEFLWPAVSKILGGSLALLLAGSLLFASTKPRYGGVLRVELLSPSISLDPRTWKPGSRDLADNERLAALVFDRLVAVDNYGRIVPQLATEWTHDAGFRRWQFTMRSGVKFSDGSALTAAIAAHALGTLLLDSWQVSASGNVLLLQSAESRPDLLEVLASGRFFVFRESTESVFVGTGPFVMEPSPKDAKPPAADTVASPNAPTQHFRFVANESCWAGRPFLDAVDVTSGVLPLRALFDLQVGKAELVELLPDMARRGAQSNNRIWSSSPVTLYALRFESSSLQGANSDLREAFTLSLDRGTMAGVLLQKQAEPAAALLPQWLSGYAFLFPVEMNAERAKQLRAALPVNVAGGTSPLHLQPEAQGDLARLLAERVAVNARQTGLSVQPVNKVAGSHDAADIKLFAWRYSSLSPGQELRDFASAEHAQESKEDNPGDPDRRYAWERKLLEERRVIPLVVIPDFVGLAPAIRDWQPSSWGEWRLSDVWLDAASAKSSAGSTNTNSAGARP